MSDHSLVLHCPLAAQGSENKQTRCKQSQWPHFSYSYLYNRSFSLADLVWAVPLRGRETKKIKSVHTLHIIFCLCNKTDGWTVTRASAGEPWPQGVYMNVCLCEHVFVSLAHLCVLLRAPFCFCPLILTHILSGQHREHSGPGEERVSISLCVCVFMSFSTWRSES